MKMGGWGGRYHAGGSRGREAELCWCPEPDPESGPARRAVPVLGASSPHERIVDVARAATRPQPGGGGGMDVVHERVCGLDGHKRTVVACVLVPGAAGTVTPEPATFSTMLGELERLAGWLAERGVTHV